MEAAINTETMTEGEIKASLDVKDNHNTDTAQQIYIKSVQRMLETPPFSYKQRLSERIAKKMVLDGHMIFANAAPGQDGDSDEGHETDGLNDKAEEYKKLSKEQVIVIQSPKGTMDTQSLKMLCKLHPGIQEEGLQSVTSDNIAEIQQELSTFLELNCKFAKRAVMIFQGDQVKACDVETLIEFIKVLIESTSNIFPLEIEVVFTDAAETLTFVFASRNMKQLQCMKLMGAAQHQSTAMSNSLGGGSLICAS